MEVKREKGTYIRPEEGMIYTNRGGGEFLCTSVLSDRQAIMRRTTTGWTCVAHGIQQYEDETIEWDYSTDGHWCWMEGRL